MLSAKIDRTGWQLAVLGKRNISIFVEELDCQIHRSLAAMHSKVFLGALAAWIKRSRHRPPPLEKLTIAIPRPSAIGKRAADFLMISSVLSAVQSIKRRSKRAFLA